MKREKTRERMMVCTLFRFDNNNLFSAWCGYDCVDKVKTASLNKAYGLFGLPPSFLLLH